MRPNKESPMQSVSTHSVRTAFAVVAVSAGLGVTAFVSWQSTQAASSWSAVDPAPVPGGTAATTSGRIGQYCASFSVTVPDGALSPEVRRRIALSNAELQTKTGYAAVNTVVGPVEEHCFATQQERDAYTQSRSPGTHSGTAPAQMAVRSMTQVPEGVTAVTPNAVK